jgi:uncharacterized protein (TIGR03086 family)
MTEPDPLAALDRAATAAAAVVSAVSADHFDAATPCPEWTVRQVLNHLVGGNLAFAARLTGGAPVDRSADHLGADPLASLRASVAELRAAFAAGSLDRIVPGPFGDMRARFLVTMRINELMVHGWDLAKATGQSTDLDPELAALCLEDFRQMRSGGRGAGMFAEPTEAPDGATVADQLAALAGRTVA